MEKPGFQVTINDASETIVIDEPTAKKNVKEAVNADQTPSNSSQG